MSLNVLLQLSYQVSLERMFFGFSIFLPCLELGAAIGFYQGDTLKIMEDVGKKI
jgi:hypothetical protein